MSIKIKKKNQFSKNILTNFYKTLLKFKNYDTMNEKKK